jgi:hypothetical protein
VRTLPRNERRERRARRGFAGGRRVLVRLFADDEASAPLDPGMGLQFAGHATDTMVTRTGSCGVASAASATSARIRQLRNAGHRRPMACIAHNSRSSDGRPTSRTAAGFVNRMMRRRADQLKIRSSAATNISRQSTPAARR